MMRQREWRSKRKRRNRRYMKRIAAVFLALAFVFSVFALSAFAATVRGDVDGDGEVNAKDYIIIKRFVLGTFEPTSEQFSAADIDLDGSVNAKDYVMLKRIVLGTGFFTVLDNYELYDSDTVKRDVLRLANAYPEVLTAQKIGQSVNGKDIYALFMGSGETELLITAGIHARENLTVNYILRVIEDYSDAYCRGAKYLEYDMRSLLEKVTVCFVPCVNPDGLDIVNKDLLPNINETFDDFDLATWKANANGVDLNRNFPFMWEEASKRAKSKTPGKMYYPGPSAASEPETQAIMRLVEEHGFDLNVNFHTKGKIIYWRDAGNGVIEGDEHWADVILQKLDGYGKAPVSTYLNVYGGGLENWFRSYTGKNAMNVELANGKDGSLPYNNETMRKEYGRDIYDYYSEPVLDWERTRGLLAHILSSL